MWILFGLNTDLHGSFTLILIRFRCTLSLAYFVISQSRFCQGTLVNEHVTPECRFPLKK